MAQLLITKGAHVNASDKKDRKPIHWAAYMGREKRSFKKTALNNITMDLGVH